MISLIVVLTVIFIIVFKIYWSSIRPSKRIYDYLREQGISCEPFVPIVGQLPEIRRFREQGHLIEFHEKLTKKHGKTYLFSLGPYPRLVIQDVDYLSDILGRSQSENFFKPADFVSRLKPLIGVENLLVTNGYEHERARKMLNPAFHHSNLQSMISIMTQETNKLIDSLSDQSSIDFSTYFNRLTLSIIASSAFGLNFQTVSNGETIISRAFTDVLGALIYRTTRLIPSLPLIRSLPFWKKTIIDQASKEMNKFVDEIINDRRQGRSESLCIGPDLLDLLLQAVDANGQGFSHQQIKDQALTFVLAGHETTSNLMSWAVYVLMTNPSVYQACRDEVDRILPNLTILTNEHLNELIIIEAVLQETLRLYPPVPYFIRESIKDQTIGKSSNRPIKILSGTTILINSYAIHRRPDYWPRPLEFDYTRWLRDPITGLKPKLTHPFCYLPFAAGPRNCIGQNFALLEAKVILSILVQRCQFELETGQTIIPDIRITMRPKYGIRAKIKPRTEQFNASC